MNSRSLTGILAGGLALALTGCQRQPARTAAAPPSKEVREDGKVVMPPGSPKLKQIRTETVGVRETPKEVVTAPGRVEVDPNRVSRVLMPVPGRVRAVLVRLGDAVSEGQALLTVESQEASAALSALSQAEARLRQARSAEAKAEKDLARLKDLLAHRAAALKDVGAAEYDLVQAQSEVATVGAEVREARARLDVLGLKADSDSREVTVRAPIAGKVMEIAVAPGEYRTDTAASLMTVADLSTVWITSNVPEGSIRLIQVGEPVEIVLVAYPGETLRGRVTRISDIVDAATRTVKVHAELANPGGRFRPEMFGSISHSHGTRSVPVVPASAIVQTGEGPMVYLETGAGVFERAKITVDTTRNGLVPVLSGLRGGERVVADGALLLNGN